MLMGVHYIKQPRISAMWLGWEWDESHISILLTDACGDSGWLGIKCAVAYGIHRWVGLVN